MREGGSGVLWVRAYCRLVSLSGPMKRHNRWIWKEQSESGMEGEGQQRENRGGGQGGRTRKEVISPLTESSRRQEKPRWGEMDGSVTDWIELETVPLCRLGLHVKINRRKQSTICSYFNSLQMQQSHKHQKTFEWKFHAPDWLVRVIPPSAHD